VWGRLRAPADGRQRTGQPDLREAVQSLRGDLHGSDARRGEDGECPCSCSRLQHCLARSDNGTLCLVLQVGMSHNTTRSMRDNEETAIRGCRATFVFLTGGPDVSDAERQLKYKGRLRVM